MENSIIVFCGIAAFMATNIGIRNFDKKRKNKFYQNAKKKQMCYSSNQNKGTFGYKG